MAFNIGDHVQPNPIPYTSPKSQNATENTERVGRSPYHVSAAIGLIFLRNLQFFCFTRSMTILLTRSPSSDSG